MELSLFAHASLLTVSSTCGYIHSILWVRNLRPRWISNWPKVTQLLSGRSGIQTQVCLHLAPVALTTVLFHLPNGHPKGSV